MQILLDKNKKYYKANLHTHTTQSDGHSTPEKIKEEYKAHGYSVVAFTDHEHIIDNSHLNDEDFLTITSCEIAIKEFENISTSDKTDMKVCHLNLYSLDPHNVKTPCYAPVYDHYVNEENKELVVYDGEYHRVYSKDGINEIINKAREEGFIVSYNHPGWSLEDARTYIGYKNLFAVEIHNTACVNAGIPDDEVSFDHFLRNGDRLFCTACDDCHTTRPFGSPYNDSFGGWVQINADSLDYKTIMGALQKGDFYASTGPEIYSLIRNGDTVNIECSSAKKISLITGSRRAKTFRPENGEFIDKAEFILSKSDNYFRIRVEDEQGKKAYTQAYFI